MLSLQTEINFIGSRTSVYLSIGARRRFLPFFHVSQLSSASSSFSHHYIYIFNPGSAERIVYRFIFPMDEFGEKKRGEKRSHTHGRSHTGTRPRKGSGRGDLQKNENNVLFCRLPERQSPNYPIRRRVTVMQDWKRAHGTVNGWDRRVALRRTRRQH